MAGGCSAEMDDPGSPPSVRSMDIDLGERSYSIHVGNGIVSSTGHLIRKRLPQVRTCGVVTSDGIPEIHVEALTGSLESAGLNIGIVKVPDGEEAKSWEVAGDLIGELLDIGLDRRSAVIAFGGGAIGDLAGFAAAIYMRGVSLVQVPTTLLAQVDSSYGGKTAVNHPKGKNLIGAFYQPSLVVSDQGILGTLPRRELLSGMGEVVKHGVIADPELFKLTETEGERLMNADPDALSEAVIRSVAIKGRLVQKDERDDKGARAILNYGHTIGHALETMSHHGLRHGEAVTLGMEVAARISLSLRLMASKDVERQTKTLESIGFDLNPPESDLKTLMEVTHRDKKAVGDTINLVLPTGIGKSPIVKGVQDSLILETLKGMGYG
ncbi:3-dehydroquinate synthase [subsurface metagenome]